MSFDPEIGDRLQRLRIKLGLSRSEFGEKIGFPGTRVQDIERGKQKPPLDFLAAVQDKFPVNPKWLLRKEGEMLLSGAAEPMPVDQWMSLATGRTAAERVRDVQDIGKQVQEAHTRVNQALQAVEFVPTMLQREALKTVAFADAVPIERLILLIEAMRENRG